MRREPGRDWLVKWDEWGRFEGVESGTGGVLQLRVAEGVDKHVGILEAADRVLEGGSDGAGCGERRLRWGQRRRERWRGRRRRRVQISKGSESRSDQRHFICSASLSAVNLIQKTYGHPTHQCLTKSASRDALKQS